jgi:hypothetical protein
LREAADLEDRLSALEQLDGVGPVIFLAEEIEPDA